MDDRLGLGRGVQGRRGDCRICAWPRANCVGARKGLRQGCAVRAAGLRGQVSVPTWLVAVLLHDASRRGRSLPRRGPILPRPPMRTV